MARIVLVHGIGRTRENADSLQQAWTDAIATGVQAAGHADLAGQIRRDLTARMAFYADLYLRPGAQGPGDDPTPDPLLDELVLAWLEHAADRAEDARDRDEAARALREIALADGSAMAIGQAQGYQQTLRPPMNVLLRLRWFTGLAVSGIASIRPALREVTRYFDGDEPIRAEATQRVRNLIGPDTRLVIAHSLGTVVAYEALHHTTHHVALITLGSPLGMRTVIYDRIQPRPPTVPPTVTAWDNFVDRDDLIAATIDLAPLFKPINNGPAPTTHAHLNNRAQPHTATHYLTSNAVGQAVATALTDPPNTP